MAEQTGAEGFVRAYEKMVGDLSAFYWDAFTALSINGISGDYVEFGSDGGTSFNLAFQVTRHLSASRHLWAFDSFQGLPDTAHPRDEHPAFTPGLDQGGLSRFVGLCDDRGIPRPAYTCVEGYFDQTLGRLAATDAPRDIALAYVDCNLYSSTVEVLAFLAPRLKHGMVVAFDDYWCWTESEVSGERAAFHEFQAEHPQWHFERFKDPTWGGVSYVVEDATALGRPGG